MSPVSVSAQVAHVESNYSQLVVVSESNDGQSRPWGCCEGRGRRAPVSGDAAYLSFPRLPESQGIAER